MWCKQCQQDVPGVVAPDDPVRIRCPRCRSPLGSGASPPDEHVVQTAEQPSSGTLGIVTDEEAPDFVELVDWELEQDLKAVDRVIRQLRQTGIGLPKEVTPSRWRLDTGDKLPMGWHGSAEKKAARKKRSISSRWAFVSWTLLSLGIMAFVCGSVLMGWSFFADRADLWTLGMPITLVGQALLLIGVVLQLEGLWQSTRDTSDTLTDLDGQLHELQHTTSLLTTSRNGAAQSFYTHLADGASPQMLLADLKGQLDVLATRMSRERMIS
jgi:hypothetical protein